MRYNAFILQNKKDAYIRVFVLYLYIFVLQLHPVIFATHIAVV
jgi:hypothetical protein